LIYIVLAAGAAVENVFPPIPADTFVLLGAFLAERGRADLRLVFLATWICNVASALAVYGLARKWGPGFFQHGIGHFLLRPHQMEQIDRFYGRYGTPVIFVSRFLPAFRAIVPVFAGVSGVSLPRVAAPVAAASAAWYGGLIVLGSAASRNWSTIVDLFGRISVWLSILAVALIAMVAFWWWRSRHPRS
jgi:membrane protein DedA with SNARE-associated domain